MTHPLATRPTIDNVNDLAAYSHDIGLHEQATAEDRIRRFEETHNVTLVHPARAMFANYSGFFHATTGRLPQPLPAEELQVVND
ncbi:hypothetical protein FQ330_03135 [Agrococcus sediminis]|uniref:Uncharacterized protein n=1 Tax=Agrococcus sediminis TaxID=2599924 RepID=A0A5M8QQF8_9MICO|nr:hypothetical protein [Agrococcus sediminis]KAA6436412.1 hypothetical protein FQ330_03135 [Agrococcus sediminis]